MKQQDIFRALSEPSRRRILKMLQQGSLTVGEMGSRFAFTGASLSHHLSILKFADLVRTERRGQHILYSLNSSVFEDVSRIVLDLFSNRRKTT